MQTCSNKFKGVWLLLQLLTSLFSPILQPLFFHHFIGLWARTCNLARLQKNNPGQTHSSTHVYTNTQIHQFIPSSVCFLNSLHIPFDILFVNFFKFILAFHFLLWAMQRIPSFSVSLALSIPRTGVAHLQKSQSHVSFLAKLPLWNSFFARATHVLGFAYSIQQGGKNPTELSKLVLQNRLWAWGCGSSFSFDSSESV